WVLRSPAVPGPGSSGQLHDHAIVRDAAGSVSGGGDAGAGGAAHATATLGGALVLVEATPRAVLLGPGQCVVKALRADGTAGADRLGLPLTYVTLGLPLPVGAEEEHEVLTPARGIILPTPAGARAGELP